jgi:hypothetical protein
MGLSSSKQVLLAIAFVVLLAAATIPPSMTGAAYATSANLTVNGISTDGKSLSMWITIQHNGSTVKTGFTPLAFAGIVGSTYTVIASDYAAGNIYFDHWGNGSTNKSRTVTLNSNTWFNAYYRTGSSTTTTTSSSTSMQSLIPKTGILVSLYMYPGSTGSTYWQQVIDQKLKHPSVPIVAIFNPSSGPGSYKDSNIANWVAKLHSAGVMAIGYKSDNYGTTSLTDFKAAADKYKNWYNADGLFIDEFTNKAGHESHYSSITSYAKSIGMKITVGNPGTDVPKSYVGTVDVINITEGSGYMPISWLQYCVLCTSGGWHYQYDKRNFAYVRYGVSWLDTTFEVNSSQWVGLLYITSGTTADGRWFHLPSYFGTEVATLDR